MWGVPDNNARAYLNAAYQVAGQHFGVGNGVTSPGNAANMADTHDVVGAWLPTMLNFPGPGSISYTCRQVYQYSQNNKATWLDIPNSTYEIIRTVTKVGASIKLDITKRSVAPSNKGETISGSKLV